MNEETIRDDGGGIRQFLNPANQNTLIIILVVMLLFVAVVNEFSQQSLKDVTITPEVATIHEKEYGNRLKLGLFASGIVLLLVILSGRTAPKEYITLREALQIAEITISDIRANPKKYGSKYPAGEISLLPECSRHSNPKDINDIYEFEIAMSIRQDNDLTSFYSVKVDALRSRASVMGVIYRGNSNSKRYKGDEFYYINKYVPIRTGSEFIQLDQTGNLQ